MQLVWAHHFTPVYAVSSIRRKIFSRAPVDMLSRPCKDAGTMTYDDLIQRYGSSREAAQALKLAQNTVCNWRKRGIPAPWQRIIALTPAPKRRKAA